MGEYDVDLDEESGPEPVPDLSQLTDDELAALGKSVGVEIETATMVHPEADVGKRVALPPLVTAASLRSPEEEADDAIDFEPGGLYKGFEMIPPAEWPPESGRYPSEGKAGHMNQAKRFYVRHNDTIGLVPWPGSQVVWPWDDAWMQSLYRSEVESLLKEDEKGKKKR